MQFIYNGAEPNKLIEAVREIVAPNTTKSPQLRVQHIGVNGITFFHLPISKNSSTQLQYGSNAEDTGSDFCKQILRSDEAQLTLSDRAKKRV